MPLATRALSRGLLIYSIVIILLITWAPFRLIWPPDFTPMFMTSATDAIINVLLFFAPGFFYASSAVGDRSQGRLIIRSAAFGLLFSGIIEIGQFAIRGRYFSPPDLVTNASGAALGAWIFLQAQRRLTRQLAGRIALELPLMGLFYLLSPLLFLNALAAHGDASRLYFTPLLAMVAVTILFSVWKHRLRTALSANRLSLFSGLWFVLATLPGMAKKPRFLPVAGVGVAVLARALCHFFGAPPEEGERRFEAPTLWRVIPFFAAYLVALANGSTLNSLHGWRMQFGLANFGANPTILAIMAALEYTAAFSLLGYLIAELTGRRESTTKRAVLVGGSLSTLVGVGLEVLRGYFGPEHASVAQVLLVMLAGGSGALIYRLQLNVVREGLSAGSAPPIT